MSRWRPTGSAGRAIVRSATERPSGRSRRTPSPASIRHSLVAPSSRVIRASAARRQVAQRRELRLAETQHEREGQAAALRFVDKTRQAVARLGFAADVEAERCKKRDLGLRRDDRALSRDVPPLSGDAGCARERVDRLGAGRSGTGTALRRRRLGENERGAGVKPHPVGERNSALGRLRVVVSMSARHAMPERGSGKRISASAVDLFIASATRSVPPPCGAAKTATRTAPAASFQPPCVIGPSASRHSTSGEAARVERRCRSGRRRATAQGCRAAP